MIQERAKSILPASQRSEREKERNDETHRTEMGAGARGMRAGEQKFP